MAPAFSNICCTCCSSSACSGASSSGSSASMATASACAACRVRVSFIRSAICRVGRPCWRLPKSRRGRGSPDRTAPPQSRPWCCTKFQPLLYVFALVVADKKAPALRCTASHAAAQLVQSAQAVALGVLDHHYAGVGHIYAHLNDGGGHQCVQPSGFEVLHHGSFLLGFKLAVHQAYPALRQQGFGNVLVVALDGVQSAVRHILDGGADQIHLPPAPDLLIEKW